MSCSGIKATAAMFDHNRNSTGFKCPKKEWSREAVHSWDETLPVPKWAVHFGPCLVVGASLACFAHSLAGDFVFDDTEAVVHNVDVQPEAPLRRIFEDDFWGTQLQAESSHKSYRPLTTLTFKLNCLLAGGLVASHFHAVNVVLHALVSFLSLRLFEVLLQGAPRASLLCALLFAVHPVHTESVAAVVGRADLLCTVFFILSFLSFVRCCSSESAWSSCLWLFTSMLFSIVSMLCKEPGITVIGLCFIYDVVIICKFDTLSIITRRSNLTEVKRQLLPAVLRQGALAVVACAALNLRWRVMGSSSPVFQRIDNPASFEENFLVRVVNYNHVYALNAWLLLCPQWLCFDWSMGCLTLIRSVADIRILSSVALWVSLAMLVGQALVAADTQLRRLLCIALSLLVVPFLPASNLFFRVGFVVAERVLYLPSLGFCLLVSLGMARLSTALQQHRKILQYCIVALLLIFTVRSMQRCREWRHESSLFKSGLKVCPGNAKVHYNFAKNVGDSGDREGAIRGYREALRLHPDYDQAMNNLANILRDAGELDEARTLLERAVELRPDFAAAWMNLGIVQSSLGLLAEAEQSYRTAISHRTKYPDCYYNLGNLYLEQKRYEEAYRAWRNATRQRPTHLVSWNNLVLMLDQQGRAADAERAALQALAHLPHEPALHFQLANILGKAGKYQRSEHHFLEAIRLGPENASYHTNLGVLYHRWKKYDQAEECYRHALKLKPDLKSARDNLNMLLQQTKLQPVETKG
ncbi:protein O-mannosyl-transferase TMTC4-like [Amblyomma americanum]